MAVRPELTEAVAGTKNTAKAYNDNNDAILDYISGGLGELNTSFSSLSDSVTSQIANISGSAVTLTGAQTITGNKTFSGANIFSGNVTISGTQFEFTRCTTQPTTISTAANNKVCVVVQNYYYGDSWFRVWSDGFIEQGGVYLGSASKFTISFPKPFTTTSYMFLILHHTSSNDTGGSETLSAPQGISGTTKTTTGITISSVGARPHNWYAAGY